MPCSVRVVLRDPNLLYYPTATQALDDLTALVHLGFTNGSVVLQMTTLGWLRSRSTMS